MKPTAFFRIRKSARVMTALAKKALATWAAASMITRRISPTSLTNSSVSLDFQPAAAVRAAPRAVGVIFKCQLTLTFEEAVFGVEKEIEFEREETCSRCNGSGAEPGTTPVRCSTCNGQGEVRQVRQTILGSDGADHDLPNLQWPR